MTSAHYEKDLASKSDLVAVKNDLELKIYKEVSNAKWQVIGSITALLFIQIILKHFGVW